VAFPELVKNFDGYLSEISHFLVQVIFSVVVIQIVMAVVVGVGVKAKDQFWRKAKYLKKGKKEKPVKGEKKRTVIKA
jgi:hypothetical protein